MVEQVSLDDIKSARRQHRCNYCAGVIDVGAPYQRAFNIWDGEAYTWKAHHDCAALAQKYDEAVGYDDGIPEMSQWEIHDMSTKFQEEYNRIVARASAITDTDGNTLNPTDAG